MPDFEDWFLENKAWSLTQHKLMKSCKRAYYYKYIGSFLKSSPDLNIPELKRLKKLNSKYVIQGTRITIIPIFNNSINTNTPFF